ncbi:non-ribosomal peptide synthase protein (TIGR01720 family)/amino acid adenylation domain-containing protein [Chitinophaga niastensis]|uniref:Non-ribosomal peptide synthase protein (TIGR01720 family)/amino acid adenylation domain-containing protein n=1 Tax=Chitinophaga niastensis TaxID=536980 RepID=A0A2P8HD65_CHINA|nr:non-ribosomal peptide synthetase [Chitinophaga niastensis]PSL44170.1 non-ribosomal peptide synthase protein (TIGR01720 family)/amino acid adenylation domain-containing protein [Chitinophaga niastensis]
MSQEIYPLHPAQRDIFIDQLINIESTYNNIGGYLKLSGSLHKEKFVAAATSLPAAFDAFRMRFDLDDPVPVMYFEEEYHYCPLGDYDFSDQEISREEVEQWVKEQVNIPFIIKKEYPLFEQFLVKLHADEYWWCFKVHHLVSDGWGVSSMSHYLAKKYNALFTGIEPSFNYPSYKEEAIRADDYYHSNAYTQEGNYWKSKIGGKQENIFKKKFQQTQQDVNLKNNVYLLDISADEKEMLEALQEATGTGLQQLTIAALMIHFAKTTDHTEYVFGIPLHKRKTKPLRNIAGMFTGIIPFKGVYEPATILSDLIKYITSSQREDYRYQNYLISDLARELKLNFADDNLIEIVVNHALLNFEMEFEGGVQAAIINLSDGNPLFPLGVMWKDYGKQQALELRIDFQQEYFSPDEIPLLAHRIMFILKQFQNGLPEPIENIRVLPEAEAILLAAFNNTTVLYPHDQTLHGLFAAQVVRTPDTLALVYGEETITYQELDIRSSQLAHYLCNQGVRKGTLVPVCMERSVELIVALLGILKAGAAYVPIDPEYPAARISYMLTDTAARLIVSTSTYQTLLSGLENITVIRPDMDRDIIKTYPSTAPANHTDASQLAYVIYTSGSTGLPKGVMVAHQGVVNLVHWHLHQYEVNANSKSTVLSGEGFDAFGWEVWPYLSAGATLHIIHDDTRLAVRELITLYRKYAITHSFLPTGLFTEFISAAGNKITSLKYLLTGGDRLPATDIRALDYRVVNNYGPTENSVVATSYQLSPKDKAISPLIGKPVHNTRIYILNRLDELCPVGTVGEICIAGRGLAAGYLNLPELTAEKFISDPFSGGTGKLYRTGDLGRWLPDGNIAYAGRIDDQVKIRGYRIEPGEIESVLQQCELVDQAVVLASADQQGHKRLVAFIIPHGTFEKAGILTYLKSRLPEYMVPALLIQIDQLPLTPNGKIDRKALSVPDESTLLQQTYVAPRNQAEQTLVAIWQELLGISRVGIHDNFFESGGDSIIMIQVVSRAKRSGYELQPRDLFTCQTIAGLAALLAAKQGTHIVAEQGSLIGNSGLLPIQQWFFETVDPGNVPEEKVVAIASHFNQHFLLKTDKNIDNNRMAAAIRQLVQQHDTLRFSYRRGIDGWTQTYGDQERVLETADLQHVTDVELENSINECIAHHERMLHITTGALIRAVLILTPAGESCNRLLLVIHHLAVDGVSWRILLDDLHSLLEQDSDNYAARKGSSYRQWYNTLLSYGQQRRLLNQQSYWQQITTGYIPLKTATEWKGAITASDIHHWEVCLDTTQTRALLQEVPAAYHTEINDILLCALSLTLSAWGNTSKVWIGLEGHGREDLAAGIDTSHTTGWFTNLYPVLLQVADSNDPGEQLIAVKEQLRRIPGKGIGYGVLKYINKAVGLQGKTPWDIVFNYLGRFDQLLKDDNVFHFSVASFGAGMGADFPVRDRLSVNSFIRDGELVLRWSYSHKHYKQEHIDALAEAYLLQLQSLMTHCLLQQISVFTPSDYGLGEEISMRELNEFLSVVDQGHSRRSQIAGVYRLSGLQEGMLFHRLYGTHSGAYMEQFSCGLNQVAPDIFRKSWEELLQRHSILRSAFYSHAFSIPVQCVYKEAALPFVVLDYGDMQEDEQLLAWENYKERDRQQGFDFTSPCLMRISLIRFSDTQYHLLWSFHHILFDGWSVAILIEELLGVYELLVKGGTLPPIIEDRYEDYIRYQDNRDKEAEEEYWRSYLSDITTGSLLPFIAATADRNKGIGSYQHELLQLNEAVSAQLTRFAQRHRITLNTVMQGAWAYLLSRYTGSEDVSYGVTVSGRPDVLHGIEQRVGLYINTLPFRARGNAANEIVDWLQLLQANQVKSREHQHTPLSSMLDWSGVGERLFDSLLVFENYPVSKVLLSRSWQLQLDNIAVHEHTNYPLTIIITGGEKISIRFNYNSELLTSAAVGAIAGHFEQVLRQLMAKESGRLADLSFLTIAEQAQLITTFNDTAAPYPENETIVDLFAQQALRTPDNVAIVSANHLLTYQELDERSNQLAHYLRSKGVTRESLVPVCIERSADMLIGIMGIMKAGAAYVPVDPEYPAARISFMLEDTAAPLILCSRKCLAALPAMAAQQIILTDAAAIADGATLSLTSVPSPDHLAYIIYTSGSTGKPKGVMITHGNLVNYLLNSKASYITETDTRSGSFIHFSYSFDASLTAMFMPLLYGRSVVISGKQQADIFEDPLLWKYAPYDFIKLTPAHLPLLEEALHKVPGGYLTRKLVVGGEALQPAHLQYLYDLGIEMDIINEYGPTETTVGCSTYWFNTAREDQPRNNIPIGSPISNVQIYIVDAACNLVPVGMEGEICIAGAGLACGYLNRPELTTEKFVLNSFSETVGTKMYRTGDLGRWLTDGVIEYTGRIDDQVKIRGYRIELGEIENVLQECELVSQGAVIVQTDHPGDKRLAAYVVPRGNFEKEAILAYLADKLPEYMVPSLLVALEQLPLTTNGKIDRKALPDAEGNTPVTNSYIPPRNETEQILADIWQELLEVERVGVHDNFFELGGNSLLAMRVISLLRKRLHKEVSLDAIFLYVRLADLALHIRQEATPLLSPAITITARPSRIPLSYSQERLWFIDQLEGSVQYHIPLVLRLKGRLQQDALIRAFKTIIDRHEVLRTVIVQTDGIAYQQVREGDQWTLHTINAATWNDDEAELQSKIQALITQPFDLAADHMLRAYLLELTDTEHLLVITAHHIAFDGWSGDILVRELAELYNAFVAGKAATQPRLPFQYADYAIWQRSYLSGKVLSAHLDYWSDKLSGVSPLQLPVDHPRPFIQSTNGAAVLCGIEDELYIQLQALSAGEGTTLFMTLLAAFNVLLHRYSGQEDICVGSPAAGRMQHEVEGLIGFFINTIALRSDLKNNPSFITLLAQVKETTLSAYKHQDAPFEKVVEAVLKERDMSHHPLFQVMFTLLNAPEAEMYESNGLQLSPEMIAQTRSQFDLTFSVKETAGSLLVHIAYCTDLYKEDTINRMFVHYKQLLQSIVANPALEIGALKMISHAEEDQLLFAFNDTATAYPQDKTIVTLFAEQVLRTPDAIAVVFEEHTLTYAALDVRAARLAHYLRSKGVTTETLVPICLERSLEMIIGILGILKAGAAYVPVDPAYPPERINYILTDTRANLIISSIACEVVLPALDLDIIRLDADNDMMADFPATSPVIDLRASHLAYVIYTSGSTGKPKGVMNEHGGVVNRLQWTQDYFRLDAHDAVLQKTTYCFDVSVWELLWPLIAGARLVFAAPGGQKDTAYLCRLIATHRITTIHFVPSMLAAFLEEVAAGAAVSLERLLCSGEALKPQHVIAAKDKLPQVTLYNLYGPTEAAVDVSCWQAPEEVPDLELVPIGTPIANTQLYILDKYGAPVPIGVAGELYIGGIQVARGYLNLPALTAEKFIYHKLGDKTVRCYKTGDLARWLADGNIAYIGRIDDQVKIRGYRIELGEIEYVLQQCEWISQAVTVVREDKQGHKRLTAYVVPVGSFDKDAIFAYLKSKLPEYMVPALLIALEQLPLTANGKVDRKSLPDPDMTAFSLNTYIPPRNETERALATVWQELLGVSRLSINDNFFELGGDSIITIQVVSRAKRHGYELLPRDLFTHQTIADLSALLSTRQHAAAAVTEQDFLSGSSGLLPIQQWYFETAAATTIPFNQSVLLAIDKNVDAATLGSAIQQLVRYHDALRFVYNRTEHGWEQQYGAYSGELAVEELSSFASGSLTDNIVTLANKYQHRLLIETGILIRAVLLLTPADETHNRLLLVIHHLAVDGVSWRILLDDLHLLLEGEQLSMRKGSSYRQWYAALMTYSHTQRLLKQGVYWQQVINNAIPMRVDIPAEATVLMADMGYCEIRLDALQTQRLLQEVPQVYHTEMNDILLSALALTLSAWNSSDAVIIGLEGHGREEIISGIDTSHIVGWFTSLYPVLLQITPGGEPGDILAAVKEQLRQVPDKGIGYGVLKYLNKATYLQGKDPWDIIFNYLGQLDHAINTDSKVHLSAASSGSAVGNNYPIKEKLSVSAFIRGGELVMGWSYSKKHYLSDSISSLTTTYLSHLQSLITHCISCTSPVYTPADFGLGGEVANEELKRFLADHAVQRLYRLSGLQEGMLFHGLYEEHTRLYMEQFTCELKNTDPDILQHAWEILVQRHSILRSAFHYHEFRIPVQGVYKEVSVPFHVLDYRHMSAEKQAAAWEAYRLSDHQQGFDFTVPCLMRVSLVQLDDIRYRLLWSFHHILCDGWSVAVLIEELLKVYESLATGKPLEEVAEDCYEDYIRYLNNRDTAAEENYWRGYLSDITGGSFLPFIAASGNRHKGSGQYRQQLLRMEETFTRDLTIYTQRHRITLNTLMQGVWAYLLSQYTGREDITYGITVSGRPEALGGIEQRVGLYINTLPLYTRVTAAQHIIEWLHQLQEDQLRSREYQYVSLSDIQHWCGISDGLFDSLLVFENYPVSKTITSQSWQLQIDQVAMSEQANYPLAIIIAGGEHIHLRFDYDSELLSAATIAMIAGHFQEVLRQLLLHESGKLTDLSLLTSEEQYQLLTTFNNTATEYPKDKTIIDLFSEQVLLTPHKIAVSFETQSLTYQQLDERSDRLAHYLHSKGVTIETMVPVFMDRSIEMMIGILGILKAGGAYVPVDPEYPAERIYFMLSESNSPVLITTTVLRHRLYENEQQLIFICLDEPNPVWSAVSATSLHMALSADNLAYVMYTSGSTGQPKGVLVTHHNVTSLVLGANYIMLTGEDTILSAGSLSFDATTFEYWSMLLHGGHLVLSAKDSLLDVALLKRELVDKQVTKMFFTTSWFNQLVTTDITVFENLSAILTGGEKLSEKQVAKLMTAYPHIAVSNIYGPTENTTFSLSYLINNKGLTSNTPIGYPLNNRSAFILNASQQLVPIGVAGEIYLGGDGLSRGYLNRPELTAEKFIVNPFSDQAGDRLYRTGDAGRWLPDGSIAYIGRIDDQVKIRGYRIEPGEVESVLQQCEAVSQAVVLVKADQQGHKRLIGYVVPTGDFNKEAILIYLKARLPEYMVPGAWMVLDQLPLTTNGKVDRKALPDPESVTSQINNYIAPRDAAEQLLADIWQELLGVSRVGINDNFFELGGDSIITIQVVSRARKAGYALRPRDLFMRQTIAGLTAWLSSQQEVVGSGEQGILVGSSGLLPIQQWYFEKSVPAAVPFNQSMLLSIAKRVDASTLSAAIARLLLYHDALRFIYTDNGHEQQQSYGTYEGRLEIADLRSVTIDQLTNEITKQANYYECSLDIAQGVLVRAVLLLTPESESHNRFMLVIHHLAVDGVSWRILLDDLSLLLQNGNLPVSKGSSYRQWYDTLLAYSQRRRLQKQAAYWQRVVAAYVPFKTTAEWQGGLTMADMGCCEVALDVSHTRSLLQEASAAYHTGINDLLLCALAITLSEWNHTSKVVIGLEGHGREDLATGIDLSRTVGWFTSLYPVLLQISPGSGSGELIKSVKEQLRQVPDKGIGYGVLKYISKANYLQGEDPWDIVFNYLGQADHLVKQEDVLSVVDTSSGADLVPAFPVSHKLSVTCLIKNGALVLQWRYANKYYLPDHIIKIAAAYLYYLKSLITHCVAQSTAVFTPADYGLAGEVTNEELNIFLEDCNQTGMVEGIYRLSGLQAGMLFHGLYGATSGVYQEQFTCTLKQTDVAAFRKSWKKLLQHHSILRSAFYYDKLRLPVQCVYSEAELPFTVLDFRHLSAVEQAIGIQQYEQADRQQGFDFATPCLMRICLIQLDEARYHMLWSFHHILLDGWSLPVLMEELLHIYETIVTEKPLPVIATDRYEDYIRYLETLDKEQEEEYWRTYLASVTAGSSLPFISSLQDRNKGDGSYQNKLLQLDAGLVHLLTACTQRHHITLNTLMQGVWAYLLSAYTGSEDVVYGVVVAGRPEALPGIEQRVGLYINTLPLYARVVAADNIADWLQQLQVAQLKSREYQYTPLAEIQGWCGIGEQLFDSLLVFENYPVSKVLLSQPWKLQIEQVAIREQTNYPLTLVITAGEEINIRFDYNSRLLSATTVTAIRRHFEQVLHQLVTHEYGKLEDISCITPEERYQLITTFNNTAANYPGDKTLTGLFAAQVLRTPNAPALVFEGTALTYDALDKHSNQLANYLRHKGVTTETLVPVCMERSLDMVVAMLAILKAGGAYVPIDPEYPSSRISYILSDTRATLVISSNACMAKLQTATAIDIIALDGDADIIRTYPSTIPVFVQTGNQLAYVIYTSGSTGLPKGVMIEHKGISNLVNWHIAAYEVNSASKATSMAGMGFDAFGWEVWPYLCAGAVVNILSDDQRLSPAAIVDVYFREAITHGFLSTALVHEFIREAGHQLTALKYLLTGGDKLGATDVSGLSYKVINNYGPTENSVVTTWYPLSEKDSHTAPLIGAPVSNTCVYVLDKHLQLCPVGVPGEICIAGTGLSRGYLHQPALTIEKFITHPLSERLYRTGDLGRWQPDGTLAYIGRIDDQVKIRGYRIELGEIESVLQQSGLVSQAVVLAPADPQGHRRLVAYVVPPGDDFNRKDILSYLKDTLPAYMVPGILIALTALPLTANGKVDRKSLPDVDMEAITAKAYMAPRNATEQALSALWEDLLGISRIGIYDNFFELGGHSLMVMRLIPAINNSLGVTIPVRTFFGLATIESLAKYISVNQDNVVADAKTITIEL